MIDDTGLQLGERTHIPWGRWVRGPAHSLRVWRDIYRQMGPDELAAAVGMAWGTQARRTEIDAAIPAAWRIGRTSLEMSDGLVSSRHEAFRWW